MKTLLTTLFLLAAVASFAAQGKSKPKPKAPTTLHCAVMKGNPVNIAKASKAKMYADYKGRRYFFCCGGCPEMFKANPEKYKKSESIPTPKATS